MADRPARQAEGSHLAKRARVQPVLPDAQDVLDDATIDAHRPNPHHGRVRQFPHVEGDFAALVSIPVQASAALNEQIARVIGALARLSDAPVHAIEPTELHISLSRTFTLKRAQLAPFADALRKALKARRPLQLRAHAVKILSNETDSRFFGTLVTRPASQKDEGEVHALVASVDAVLSAFQKPPFYQPAILHFSVAWSLLPFNGFGRAVMPVLAHNVHVDCVQCKLGARVEEFRLLSSQRT